MTNSQVAVKSGFEAIGLVHGFCTEAAGYGLTPTMLQRLRENRTLMLEFISLARRAEDEYRDRIAEIQLEKERAVTVGGMHYHLVVLSKSHLLDYNWRPQDLVSDAVAHERSKGNWPLKGDAIGKVVKLLLTIRAQGQWVAWTADGNLLVWERTTEGVELIVPCDPTAALRGESVRFNTFKNFLGMVFMNEWPDCEHQDVLQD